MRFLLALLAVLTLALTPVTVAAARAACSHAGPTATAGAAMSAMPGMAKVEAQKNMGDPCCDPSGQHKMSGKGCAQACATSCAVAAALPLSLAGVTVAFAPAPTAPMRLAFVHPHEPAGLERPPKSIT